MVGRNYKSRRVRQHRSLFRRAAEGLGFSRSFIDTVGYLPLGIKVALVLVPVALVGWLVYGLVKSDVLVYVDNTAGRTSIRVTIDSSSVEVAAGRRGRVWCKSGPRSVEVKRSTVGRDVARDFTPGTYIFNPERINCYFCWSLTYVTARSPAYERRGERDWWVTNDEWVDCRGYDYVFERPPASVSTRKRTEHSGAILPMDKADYDTVIAVSERSSTDGLFARDPVEKLTDAKAMQDIEEKYKHAAR